MEIRSYLQFKLNAGRAAGEVLEWSRTRLGMSCAMSCWWERESFHCSAPPETQGQELSWAEPGTAIPTLPAGQELLQVQEWESCPSSCWWPQCRTIILGRPARRPILQHSCTCAAAQLHLLQHSCSCCSTAAPAACWAQPALHLCYLQPLSDFSLWPSGDASSCTQSTAIKKMSLHENEASGMKMKQNQL